MITRLLFDILDSSKEVSVILEASSVIFDRDVGADMILAMEEVIADVDGIAFSTSDSRTVVETTRNLDW